MTELTKSPARRHTTLRVPRTFRDLMEDFLITPWREDVEPPITMWSPRMDLVETDGAYELHVDLPGLDSDDVSIDAEGHRLVVHGQRQEEAREEETNYLRVERTFGRFYRSLTLPDAAVPERAEATFRDGVLTIHVPKSEAEKPKKISIRTPK